VAAASPFLPAVLPVTWEATPFFDNSGMLEELSLPF